MNDCKNCDHSCGQNNQKEYNKDDYLVKLFIDLDGEMGSIFIEELKPRLNSLVGVKGIDIGNESLEIYYDDYLISPEEIKSNIID